MTKVGRAHCRIRSRDDRFSRSESMHKWLYFPPKQTLQRSKKRRSLLPEEKLNEWLFAHDDGGISKYVRPILLATLAFTCSCTFQESGQTVISLLMHVRVYQCTPKRDYVCLCSWS